MHATYLLSPRLVLAIAVLALSAAVSVPPARAATAEEIDAKSDATLDRFKREVGGAQSLIGMAKGVLVFPDVAKAGFGIGGEYGEGALRVGGKSVDYYSTAAASICLLYTSPSPRD